MNYSSSFFAKRTHLRFGYALGVCLFVFCEMFLPAEGWTQAVNSGSFYFSGNHEPLRRSIFRTMIGNGKGLRVGRVTVHPYLGIAETFTDNVFVTKKQRENDFLTTIAPGMQARLPFGGKHSFLLDYRAEQLLFAKNSETNAFAQDGSGHLQLTFPSGLQIDLQGGRIDGFDRFGSALDIQTGNLTKWRIHGLLSQVQLSGQNASIRLQSSFQDQHFKNNGQAPRRDRKQFRVNLTLFVNANSTFSALLGARITNTTYDKNSQLDSFSYGGFAGFRLAPSRQLSGEFRVGFTILNFDRAQIVQGPQILVPDPLNPLTTILIDDPSDKGTQLLNEGLSLGGVQQKRLTMRGILTWRPTSRFFLQVRPSRSIRQSGVLGTSTFVQTIIAVNASHNLTPRFGVRAGVNYQNDDFEGGRRDNSIRTNIGLAYRTVEWLGFRAEYLFGKRFSNNNQFEFYNNSIMVSAQIFL